jgi:hypothetical protein
MGLIQDIPTCEDLLARVEGEANEVLSNLGKSVQQPLPTSRL